MQKIDGDRDPRGNHILASLNRADYEYILPHLKPIDTVQNDVIYRPREPIKHVYFPVSVLYSLVVVTEDGDMSEAGIVGYEGMAGSSIFLGEEVAPYQIETQLPGLAFKLKSNLFKEICGRSSELQKTLLLYMHMQLTQLAQSAVCNRFHTVEERLSRWLLVARDRVKTDDLPMTHQVLATMIGAKRPAVSIVTGTLQTAGFIRMKRGMVTILNRQGLEDTACECYRVVKDEMDKYLSQ